jgi:hypothetical protein
MKINNKLLPLIVVGIVLTLGITFLSIHDNIEHCEFRMHDDESSITALFNHVKQGKYCPQYAMSASTKDQYGNIQWKNVGYFEMSEDEFNEMKKYADVHTYLDAHNNTNPKFIPNSNNQ